MAHEDVRSLEERAMETTTWASRMAYIGRFPKGLQAALLFVPQDVRMVDPFSRNAVDIWLISISEVLGPEATGIEILGITMLPEPAYRAWVKECGAGQPCLESSYLVNLRKVLYHSVDAWETQMLAVETDWVDAECKKLAKKEASGSKGLFPIRYFARPEDLEDPAE